MFRGFCFVAHQNAFIQYLCPWRTLTLKQDLKCTTHNNPSIAQLVERRTVKERLQTSLGHWFKSGSRENFFFLPLKIQRQGLSLFKLPAIKLNLNMTPAVHFKMWLNFRRHFHFGPILKKMCEIPIMQKLFHLINVAGMS